MHFRRTQTPTTAFSVAHRSIWLRVPLQHLPRVLTQSSTRAHARSVIHDALSESHSATSRTTTARLCDHAPRACNAASNCCELVSGGPCIHATDVPAAGAYRALHTAAHAAHHNLWPRAHTPRGHTPHRATQRLSDRGWYRTLAGISTANTSWLAHRKRSSGPTTCDKVRSESRLGRASAKGTEYVCS